MSELNQLTQGAVLAVFDRYLDFPPTLGKLLRAVMDESRMLNDLLRIHAKELDETVAKLRLRGQCSSRETVQLCRLPTAPRSNGASILEDCGKPEL